MPRTARLIDVNMPYHICQRGNSKQIIYRDNKNKEYYLKMLKEGSAKYDMCILAYCLMENHVHLIVIPKYSYSLSRAFRSINGKYSRYFNMKYNKSGHLWSERYYSKVLNSKYLTIAVRYVERNPVRAGFIRTPSKWEWSSAAAHLKTGKDDVISGDFFKYTEISAKQWKEYILRPESNTDLNLMRSK
ncbi:MAG: hypothetical protein A2231_08935 [Candidatus Firestonebacteria bacterium RIFOXYA2_FULL_40_8]|nr:MAG: hypothetical protein A2231_08935 [Candidatus Firestonebacteria bacterium RIFOXYA2_FULL_40_8]